MAYSLYIVGNNEEIYLILAKTNGFNFYRKIPKIMPRGLCFSKALFEWLIFGGAYLRREIYVSNRLG